MRGASGDFIPDNERAMEMIGYGASDYEEQAVKIFGSKKGDKAFLFKSLAGSAVVMDFEEGILWFVDSFWDSGYHNIVFFDLRKRNG